MGAIYQFFCPACGYDIEVSGGADSGMSSVTTTIVCEDCRELRDICISKDPQKALSPDGEGLRPDFEFDLRCKKCKGTNVKRWTDPGLCPKCGKMMDRVALVCNWD